MAAACLCAAVAVVGVAWAISWAIVECVRSDERTDRERRASNERLLRSAADRMSSTKTDG